jgi:2-polyprenyl-3-methyl-5-hydroxy-6-metoxy-1,4-benzoquinol methylase
MSRQCEVCGAGLLDWRIRGGGVLQRCPDCRHVLRDLTACPANMRELGYGGDPGLDAVRLRLTARRLRGLVRAGRSVFEIGYGSGALLRRFLDEGWSVGGVDAGQLEVGVDPEVARRGALVQGELETAAVEGRYDLVVGVHVLEHLRDPAEGLAAAYRLLRPGGVLALITPTADSYGAEWFGAAWWLLEDPTHLRFFSPDSARRALAAAGFERTAVRRLTLDTLSMEAASLRRTLSPRPRPAGVLAERATVVATLATAPVTVAARLALPRLRPSLELITHRPG